MINPAIVIAFKRLLDDIMGRIRLVTKLLPEQQATLEALLRRYRYGGIDIVLGELQSQGIVISRSALHRHAQLLKSNDTLLGADVESTMVVVIDLRSGGARQIRTVATPDIVIGAIGDLTKNARSSQGDQPAS